jgi:hypothetical protein
LLDLNDARGRAEAAVLLDQLRYAFGERHLGPLSGVESADGDSPELVVLVVVDVAVAVLEVLDPGVVGRVLRGAELSTSPRRRLAPISGATAPDRAGTVPAVSVVRVAVPS